jgi:hypothetical protein
LELRVADAVLLSIAVVACGDDADTRDGAGGSGGTVPPPVGCAPGEVVPDDGGCRPAGIPPGACAPGFEPHEVEGCVAVMPSSGCAAGQMAMPGETACREPSPCAAGRWGDIPIDASTIHVDAAYVGTSTGTAAQPHSTIQAAIDAAGARADVPLVAVAAGIYQENLDVRAPVRIRGVCARLVDVRATSTTAFGAIVVGESASGSAIGGISVTGPRAGIDVTEAEVTLEDLWIHDTGDNGLQVVNGAETAGVVLRNSLVERAKQVGVVALGARIGVERSSIRETRPDASGEFGRGFVALSHPEVGTRSVVAVSGSVLEGNMEIGIDVAGSDADIEASLVHDTRSRTLDGLLGHGIFARDDPATGEKAVVAVRASVVRNNRAVGVFLTSADVTVATTVVAGTIPPDGDKKFGRGISAERDPLTTLPVALTLRDSLVVGNTDIGVFVAGASATIEGTAIRGTLPSAADGGHGWGLVAMAYPTDGTRSSLVVGSSTIADNHGLGVLVTGSDAVFESTAVRDTKPQLNNGELGRGIGVQLSDVDGAPSLVSIRDSLVERCYELGIFVVSSEVELASTRIDSIAARPSDGLFGDGLSLWSTTTPARVVVEESEVAHAGRAGIASFGGLVEMRDTVLECNAIDLDAEVFADLQAEFVDRGANVCGCSGATRACVAQSSGLAPPMPVTTPGEQ